METTWIWVSWTEEARMIRRFWFGGIWQVYWFTRTERSIGGEALWLRASSFLDGGDWVAIRTSGLEYPQLGTQQWSHNLLNHKLELKTPYFSSRGWVRSRSLAITGSSTVAWKIPWTEEPGRLHAVHGVAKSRTWPSDFTFTFHFQALEKEMATHSSVLAWRIPGTGEAGGLPSMRWHRVGHDWSDLAAAVQVASLLSPLHSSLDGSFLLTPPALISVVSMNSAWALSHSLVVLFSFFRCCCCCCCVFVCIYLLEFASLGCESR